MSALDRLLCERLGIRHTSRWWSNSVRYPALSTTGHGMLLLMETLEKAGHSFTVDSGGVACVCTQNGSSAVRASRAQNRAAPMALALAAAAALGVEVPE